MGARVNDSNSATVSFFSRSSCMYLIFPPPGLVTQMSGEIITQEMSARKRACHLPIANNGTDLNSLLPERRCTIDNDRRQRAFAAWVAIYSIVGKAEKKETSQLHCVYGVVICVCLIDARYRRDDCLHHRSPLP